LRRGFNHVEDGSEWEGDGLAVDDERQFGSARGGVKEEFVIFFCAIGAEDDVEFGWAGVFGIAKAFTDAGEKIAAFFTRAADAEFDLGLLLSSVGANQSFAPATLESDAVTPPFAGVSNFFCTADDELGDDTLREGTIVTEFEVEGPVVSPMLRLSPWW
jgi:hypothetical protein